jgi:hypothetical protein
MMNKEEDKDQMIGNKISQNLTLNLTEAEDWELVDSPPPLS